MRARAQAAGLLAKLSVQTTKHAQLNKVLNTRCPRAWIQAFGTQARRYAAGTRRIEGSQERGSRPSSRGIDGYQAGVTTEIYSFGCGQLG